MLEIKGLTGGYINIPVLKDISFTVENGELVGLIGLNGAGKSTTINEIIEYNKNVAQIVVLKTNIICVKYRLESIVKKM